MNSEIYEKNMIALRKRFPNLADLVEKKKELQKRCLEIQVKNTEEESIVCVRQGIHTLYMEGKRKPKETAKRRLEQWGKNYQGYSCLYCRNGKYCIFERDIEPNR